MAYDGLTVIHTSLSGLVAHSRDSRGDFDMMVAFVCMMGFNDQTCKKKRGQVKALLFSSFSRGSKNRVFFVFSCWYNPKR